MSKISCDVCGYATEVPGLEDEMMIEMPEHCGQPMRVEEE